MKRSPLKRKTPLRPVGKKGSRDKTELDEARAVVMLRSKGRCEARFSDLCTGLGLHAHHIRKRSQGGSNDPQNLLWCCFPCHSRIHADQTQARMRGLLRQRGDGDVA